MKEIKTWKEAEQAMADYEHIGMELRLAEDKMLAQFNLIRSDHAGKRQELENASDAIASALTKFAKAHKKEFMAREEGGDARSIEYAGVAMGYRLDPPNVRIEEEDEAVDWLIRTGYGDECVRTRVEPNRGAIRDLLNNDADPLVEKFAAHGITLQQKDRFFLEILETK